MSHFLLATCALPKPGMCKYLWVMLGDYRVFHCFPVDLGTGWAASLASELGDSSSWKKKQFPSQGATEDIFQGTGKED